MGFGISAVLAVVVALIWPSIGGKRSSAAPHASVDDFAKLVVPFMNQHCAKCHTGETAGSGNLVCKICR